MSDAISILIVDDESPARAVLSRLLDELAPVFPHRIVGEAGSATEALARIDELRPQVVLLDIQLPDMSGIELARHLVARAAIAGAAFPMPAVIFVTASDDFAVDAFEVRAIDYVLKPVRFQRLHDALRHALAQPPARVSSGVRELATATDTRRRHLSIHERGKVILVPLDQVVYLKAELKYITVRTREREHLIEESLTALEEEFADRFVRIHRNALVARSAIGGFERVTPTGDDDAGDPYWQVVLRGISERLPVSRRQWSTVKNLLQ